MCFGILFVLVMEEFVLVNVMFKFDWVLFGGMKDEDLDMSECIGIIMYKKIFFFVVVILYNVM